MEPTVSDNTSSPLNLNSLCTEIKSLYNNNTSNIDIITYLENICQENGIRVRKEMIPESDNTYTCGRIILSYNKMNKLNKFSNFKMKKYKNVTQTSSINMLYYQANGIVIDSRNWKVLSVPVRAFNRTPKLRQVDAHLANKRYQIIPIEDGTIVTLYNWEGKWCMSTSNAYDVSTLIWCGDRTYSELFYELVDKYYAEFKERTGITLESENGPRLNFTNLDPGKCYTLGFRHHTFHPLLNDGEKIWQIQCVDTSQYQLPVIDYELPGIPMQEVRECKFDTFNDILSAARISIPEAKAHISKMLSGDTTPCKFNYGYALKSLNVSETTIHSDILVETPLLKYIRKVHYTNPNINSGVIVPANLVSLYNGAKMLLSSPEERKEFLDLHPHWADTNAKYANYIEQVTKEILELVKITEKTKKTITPKNEFSAICMGLLQSMQKNIKGKIEFSSKNPDAESIIRNAITLPEHAMQFIKIAELLK